MRIKLVCVLVFLLSMGSLFAEPQGSPPMPPVFVTGVMNKTQLLLRSQ